MAKTSVHADSHVRNGMQMATYEMAACLVESERGIRDSQKDDRERLGVASVAGRICICVEAKLQVLEFIADKSHLAEFSGTL